MNLSFKNALLPSMLLFSTVSYQSVANDVTIKPQQLSESVYVLFGRGGNIAAHVGEDGIYIVDDQFANLSDKIKAAIKDIKPGAPEFVINTHHHGDHTGGNEAFAEAGAHVISHHNVRGRLVDKHGEGSAHLPVLTYQTQMTLHFNGEHADLWHYAKAHTDGDSVVFFNDDNIVHMGDIYFNLGSLPFVDVDGGGSVDGLINAVNDVLSRIDDATQVIPGHGPMSNKAELGQYLALVKKAKGLVVAAMAGDKTEDQVWASRPLASLNLSYANWLPEERVTRLFYRSLKTAQTQ